MCNYVYVVTKIDEDGCEDLKDVFGSEELAKAYVITAGAKEYFYERFEVKDD